MKAYVYTDAGLERYAGRFVWLSINTEDARNAAFLKRYPINVLPTVLVLDARRNTVTMRYVGGATFPQLLKLLDEAEKSWRAGRRSTADTLLAKGDRLASEGKDEAAARAYTNAIAAAPPAWRNLGRAGEALVLALSMAYDHERCAVRAAELAPRLEGTPAGANVSAMGLSCAVAMKPSNHRRRPLLDALEERTLAAFSNPKIELSDDDRSMLYMALIEARDASGDDEEVVRLKHEWAAFLERAAARARTPEQRTVYDSHRVTAYLELGTPHKAVPMLEQSERDFPDDYNPPARLAVAYKAMREYVKALAASDRALARVYGPRKIAVLSVRAEIYAAMGDPKAARETMQQALAFARSLPEGQRSPKRIAALESRLAAMP